MRLTPSLRFDDRTGAPIALFIPHTDTCAALETGIDRALREAGSRGASNTRIEIYDVDTGRLVQRVHVTPKEKINVKA
jgi:hypothetical protein